MKLLLFLVFLGSHFYGVTVGCLGKVFVPSGLKDLGLHEPRFVLWYIMPQTVALALSSFAVVEQHPSQGALMALVAILAIRTGLHMRNNASGVIDQRKMRFFDLITVGFPVLVVSLIGVQIMFDTV